MSYKNSEILNDLSDMYMGSFIGLTISAAIIGSMLFIPIRKYEKDINVDGRQDLICEYYNGFKEVFLQQEDGSYKLELEKSE